MVVIGITIEKEVIPAATMPQACARVIVYAKLLENIVVPPTVHSIRFRMRCNGHLNSCYLNPFEVDIIGLYPKSRLLSDWKGRHR